MNTQMNMFKSTIKPTAEATEFKKFKAKLIREGYTVKVKRVNGCKVETFTRRRK